ncbi:MAG: phosphate acyltransferase PlsX, partial [Mycoplasma sp.]
VIMKSTKMKLAVDVMGFENKISEAICACEKFSKKNNVDIILVGKKTLIEKSLSSKQKNMFEIENAEDIIEQSDEMSAIRTKKDSSMLKAIKLVVDNKADGVLSAGNSSIYVFLTYQQFGLIKGVSKPGFMPYIPTLAKNGFNVIDVGASKECNADDLYNFALMANIYTSCRGVNKPRIGVLNIGTEKHKGFEWHAEVDKKLRENKNMNYIGFVESKNLLDGVVDVLVTDGYTGNVTLKCLEGALKSTFGGILSYYKKFPNFLLFPFSASMLLSMKKKFDYKNNAGAFVLGLNKMAVKTHGSADFKQFYSALRMLKESIDNNILEKIKKTLENESEILN